MCTFHKFLNTQSIEIDLGENLTYSFWQKILADMRMDPR